ncbi:MAG: hypothetical protein ABIH83_01750 [Candidatus Micrarchaeota archaeon]
MARAAYRTGQEDLQTHALESFLTKEQIKNHLDILYEGPKKDRLLSAQKLALHYSKHAKSERDVRRGAFDIAYAAVYHFEGEFELFFPRPEQCSELLYNAFVAAKNYPAVQDALRTYLVDALSSQEGNKENYSYLQNSFKELNLMLKNEGFETNFDFVFSDIDKLLKRKPGPEEEEKTRKEIKREKFSRRGEKDLYDDSPALSLDAKSLMSRLSNASDFAEFQKNMLDLSSLSSYSSADSAVYTQARHILDSFYVLNEHENLLGINQNFIYEYGKEITEGEIKDPRQENIQRCLQVFKRTIDATNSSPQARLDILNYMLGLREKAFQSMKNGLIGEKIYEDFEQALQLAGVYALSKYGFNCAVVGNADAKKDRRKFWRIKQGIENTPADDARKYVTAHEKSFYSMLRLVDDGNYIDRVEGERANFINALIDTMYGPSFVPAFFAAKILGEEMKYPSAQLKIEVAKALFERAQGDPLPGTAGPPSFTVPAFVRGAALYSLLLSKQFNDVMNDELRGKAEALGGISKWNFGMIMGVLFVSSGTSNRMFGFSYVDQKPNEDVFSDYLDHLMSYSEKCKEDSGKNKSENIFTKKPEEDAPYKFKGILFSQKGFVIKILDQVFQNSFNPKSDLYDKVWNTSKIIRKQ